MPYNWRKIGRVEAVSFREGLVKTVRLVWSSAAISPSGYPFRQNKSTKPEYDIEWPWRSGTQSTIHEKISFSLIRYGLLHRPSQCSTEESSAETISNGLLRDVVNMEMNGMKS
jgi:hypothetical protein